MTTEDLSKSEPGISWEVAMATVTQLHEFYGHVITGQRELVRRLREQLDASNAALAKAVQAIDNSKRKATVDDPLSR